MQPRPLPPGLPIEFCTSHALGLGATKQRMRASDLERPFRGVRMQLNLAETPPGTSAADRAKSTFDLALDRELALIRALATSLHSGQFFTHRSAALLWEAPMPHRSTPDLHIGVRQPQRAPRISGVTGHEFHRERVCLRDLRGTLLTSPAHTFAMLGTLPLAELVAVGDYFLRAYREGYGRHNVGRPALATLDSLAEVVHLGRWPGMPRLRTALALVREDSWSPRESSTRVTLVTAGLPEPELNVDIYDRGGYFLGCLDMVYRAFKVGVEYHGGHHAGKYADDVERVERFRASGWRIVQVTKALERQPHVLVARVARALRDRGWDGAVASRSLNSRTIRQ